MPENPYQAPESTHTLAKVEIAGDIGLMRNTSFLGYLCVLLLGAEVMISVGAAFGVWWNLSVNISTIGVVLMTLWVSIIIMVCLWTSKSMTNAWVAGEPTPTITSGNAVLYYFTPVLWFWKPYVVMKQLWDNLFGVESSKVVIKAWWFSWLAFWACVLISIISFNSGHDSKSYYYSAGVRYCKIVAGISFAIVILRITMGQNIRIAGARINL